ncbi:UNVERIFIED_CONTAM: Anthocyanidin 3-O-glucosyltransferase 4 [Sesamum radiatum]|uniref:Anthocyanidin 3-O-glucosyltransferase 4 n=1 Tax=Sesamum radiatum TaxID=300843 RepID=A0AAW2NL47_SESRA
MITWPMFAEQFFNEKLIVNVLGIGVRVGVEGRMSFDGESEDLVRWDQVKRAIEKLMDGSEEGRMRRKRAEELAEMASNAVEEGGLVFILDMPAVSGALAGEDLNEKIRRKRVPFLVLSL